MATVCEPAIGLPPHVMDQDDVLRRIATRLEGHPRKELALRLMRNTTVRTRRAVVPIDQLLNPLPFGERNRLHLREAVALSVATAKVALAKANRRPADIDCLIVVSCTGHAIPGIDAHLVAPLGLRTTVRRIPVISLGCAAGAYALIRAADDIAAHPGSNALVIAVELPSLSYHSEDQEISALVSYALFGDACAATVIRGDDQATGLRIEHTWEHLLPDTLGDVVYELDDTGLHFHTSPRNSECVRRVVPDAVDWLRGTEPRCLPPQFLMAHTGGPKIMDTLRDNLGCSDDLLCHSRASLRELGNTASVSVLDVLTRTHTTPPRKNTHGLLIAFGPGVSTAAVAGRWNSPG